MENISNNLLILEDQIFLLNFQKHVNSETISNLFLSSSDLHSTKAVLYKRLLKLDPKKDVLAASVYMRGICNCMTILQEKNHSLQTKSECNTLQDFSHLIEEQLLHKWTKSNSLEIISHLKEAISYLVKYGWHHVLHEGTYQEDILCHHCKYVTASLSLQYCNTCSGSCHHYLMSVLSDDEDGQEEHKGCQVKETIDLMEEKSIPLNFP